MGLIKWVGGKVESTIKVGFDFVQGAFDVPGTRGGKTALSIDEKSSVVAWAVNDGRGHHCTVSFHNPILAKSGQGAQSANGEPKLRSLEPMTTAMIEHRDIDLMSVTCGARGQRSRGAGLGIAS